MKYIAFVLMMVIGLGCSGSQETSTPVVVEFPYDLEDDCPSEISNFTDVLDVPTGAYLELISVVELQAEMCEYGDQIGACVDTPSNYRLFYPGGEMIAVSQLYPIYGNAWVDVGAVTMKPDYISRLRRGRVIEEDRGWSNGWETDPLGDYILYGLIDHQYQLCNTWFLIKLPDELGYYQFEGIKMWAKEEMHLDHLDDYTL